MRFHGNKHGVAGFTLLEVLVALFIASITVGALGMTLSHMRHVSVLEQHAQRFGIWFERLRQHAVVRNITYRIDYDAEQNRLSLLEFRNNDWQQANIDSVTLVNPDGLKVKHGDSKETDPIAIYIFPDNSYSAFRFHFSGNNDRHIAVSGDGGGDVVVAKQETGA